MYLVMKNCLLLLPAFAVLGLAATAQEPAVAVVRVPNAGLQPQVAIEPGGVLDILYFSGNPKGGNLFFVRSKDHGKTFSRPMQVNSQDESVTAMGTIRGGQLAAGKRGRVHVAWNGSGSALPAGPVNPEAAAKPGMHSMHGMPMLYTRLNDQGTAFEPQRNLMQQTFGLDGGGTVAADRSGNVFVAWHGKRKGAAHGEAGRQVWVAASHDDGKTFATEAPAWKEPTGACGCCGMSIFAANDGTVFALYRSATDNVHRDIYLLASKDHGKIGRAHV